MTATSPLGIIRHNRLVKNSKPLDYYNIDADFWMLIAY